MHRSDTLEISCLIDYINDTKPYHSKLTQVSLEYQFNEDIDVNIEDTVQSSSVFSSIWKYNFVSDGSIKRFRIPAVIQPRETQDQVAETCIQIGVTDLIPNSTDSYAVPYNSGVEVQVNGTYLIENTNYVLLEERTIIQFLPGSIPVLNDVLCFNLFSIDRLFIKIDGNWVHYAVGTLDPLADISYAYDTSCCIQRYEWINEPPNVIVIGPNGLDYNDGYDIIGFDAHELSPSTVTYSSLFGSETSDAWDNLAGFDNNAFSTIGGVTLPNVTVEHRDPTLRETIIYFGGIDLILGTLDSYAIPNYSNITIKIDGILLNENLDYNILSSRTIIKFIGVLPTSVNKITINLSTPIPNSPLSVSTISSNSVINVYLNYVSTNISLTGITDSLTTNTYSIPKNKLIEVKVNTNTLIETIDYSISNDRSIITFIGSSIPILNDIIDITLYNITTNLSAIINAINLANISNYPITVMENIGNGYGDLGYADIGYSSIGFIDNLIDIINNSVIFVPGVLATNINYFVPTLVTTPLSVDILFTESPNITVLLGTDSNGNITSTANEVALAVNTHPQAQLLVSATPGGTGLDIVILSELEQLKPLYPILTQAAHINSELPGLLGTYEIPNNFGVIAYKNGIQLIEGTDFEILGIKNNVFQFLTPIPDKTAGDIFAIDFVETQMSTDVNDPGYTGTDFGSSTYFPSGIVGKIIKVNALDPANLYYTFEFTDPLPRGTTIEFCIDQRETYGTWAHCKFTEELKFVDIIRGLGYLYKDSDDYAFVKINENLLISTALSFEDSMSVTSPDGINPLYILPNSLGDIANINVQESISSKINLTPNDNVQVFTYDVPYGGGFEVNANGNSAGFDTTPWGGLMNHSGNPIIDNNLNIYRVGTFEGPEGFDVVGFDIISGVNNPVGEFDGPEGMGFRYDFAGTDNLPIDPATAFDLDGFDNSGYGGNLILKLIQIIPNFDINVNLVDQTLVNIQSVSSNKAGQDINADVGITTVGDNMVMVINYQNATPTDTFGTVSLNGGGYFEQVTPVTILTVTHNLGYNPVVTITVTGIPVVPDLFNHISTNVLEIGFNTNTAFEILVT